MTRITLVRDSEVLEPQTGLCGGYSELMCDQEECVCVPSSSDV